MADTGAAAAAISVCRCPFMCATLCVCVCVCELPVCGWMRLLSLLLLKHFISHPHAWLCAHEHTHRHTYREAHTRHTHARLVESAKRLACGRRDQHAHLPLKHTLCRRSRPKGYALEQSTDPQYARTVLKSLSTL